MTGYSSVTALAEARLPAHLAATSWINVFQATGDDKERAALFKTLLLEFFDHPDLGTAVQMIATNGIALVRAYVAPNPRDPWVADTERPDYTVIVHDVEGFALAFMKGVANATKENPAEQMTLTVEPYDDGASIALGPEFQDERLVVRACGQRLDCKLVRDAFPGWRHLKFGVDEAERVDEFRMAPKQFALLGKLKESGALDLDVGERRLFFSTMKDAELRLRGILMPMMKPRRAKEGTTAEPEDAEQPDLQPA